MTAALTQDPEFSVIENVIIGDMAPTDRPLDASDSIFLKAMAEIERGDLQSKEDAVKILERYTKVWMIVCWKENLNTEAAIMKE